MALIPRHMCMGTSSRVGVGKSSMTIRFVTSQFYDQYVHLFDKTSCHADPSSEDTTPQSRTRTENNASLTMKR